MDGLCEQMRTLYEFKGCHWHGHTCMPIPRLTYRLRGWHPSREVRTDHVPFRAYNKGRLSVQSAMGI
jgi:hypothetical protein